MTSITLTEDQAEAYDAQGPEMYDVLEDVRAEAQAVANRTGKLCEVYHPDGFVVDALTPEA